MLWRASFDETYFYRTTNTQLSVVGYGELIESWSGYSLQRSGVVPPLAVPALAENGRLNFSSDTGAIRFWFKPMWSSMSVGGTGPGIDARLAEIVAVGNRVTAVAWSLLVSPDGSALYLVSDGAAGASMLLRAEIGWPAGEWHLVALNYGPNGTALFVDGKLLAEGAGTVSLPPSVAALVVGSNLRGAETPEGEFEEVCTFRRMIALDEVRSYFGSAFTQASLGPISAKEEQALREVVANRNTQREAMSEVGGQQMMMLLGGSTQCISNVPAFITNIVATFDTNIGWTVTFDIQGGTNGQVYDIFSSATLNASSITNSQWTWLEQGPSCSTYQYTNQLASGAFYLLGTPQDTDADGLSDAYEALVSKTGVQTADTDGDGLSDGYELFTSFTDPLSAGPVPTLVGRPIMVCPMP